MVVQLYDIILSKCPFDFWYIDCPCRIHKFGRFESTTQHVDDDNLIFEDLVPCVGGVKDETRFRVDKPVDTIGLKAWKDDIFGWEGTVEMNKWLWLEREKIGG